MRRVRYLILCMLLGMAISYPSISRGEDFVIIVNKNNPITSISISKLKRIYLKNIKTWETGDRIVPVDIDEGSPLKKEFYKSIFEKAVEEMRVYWIRQRITNNIKPPRVYKTSNDIKNYVAGVKGAIGYIEKSALDDSVQVVEVH